MAIRKVREVGDDVLAKECREVKKMTPRISQLIDDMFDTMYEYNGVGLAAPQVGVLRRIIVVDVGEDPRALINPRIVHEEGKQTGEEGCLSLPGKWRGCLRAPSAMRSTIWTATCTRSLSRARSTIRPLRKPWKSRRTR